MKDRNQLWQDLLAAENKSRSGKFKKLGRAPFLYPALMLFNYAWYPFFKKGVYVKANTFFGLPLRTLLPSGTDVLLNKIKSHDSEIRLSKYLTLVLQEGDVFIDVGAHYGYYSLLASVLVGNSGKVYSIEASASSFSELKENVDPLKNIIPYHAAAGDSPGTITFYEYPGPYAEYNTIIPGAYTNEKWFQTVKEKTNTVPMLILDELIRNEQIEKAVLKIDVEGGESSVLRGLQSALKEKKLIIAMEYLIPKEGKKLHQESAEILFKSNYKSYAISSDGNLEYIDDIDLYLRHSGMDSDNIIFINT
ncbi:MAG: FkbM family methyltransferase [Saprospiraceae bacterium]|uniref:FkbM family methyltransferase n=1 Tax=Candidatus Opimibacter skivensis TaxID=2982028 RepID=A0A9D7SUA3_9BACT|nr:FkbM family methyltransferase [Candidatus Opimibacter skivensis]